VIRYFSSHETETDLYRYPVTQLIAW